MAIQKGVIQFRGKVGNVVGMKNGFGTKDSAFMRELVTDIKNPQSDFQMNQRAKMLPAVLFRRQLESVISRAWEGTKYGGPSTREFMKYALKEPWENIPQLPKDSTLPIPGAYLVSRGSLPPFGLTYDDSSNVFLFDVANEDNPSTIGEMSARFIENAPQVREGDQLTVIVAYTTDESIPYIVYLVKSVYIDTSSTQTVSDAFGPIAIGQHGAEGGNDVFSIGVRSGLALGAVAVLSREGNNTHLRSTQRFALNDVALAAYFGTSLKESVADTYRTRNSANNINWPYENSETPMPTTEDALYTLSGLTGNQASLNGRQVRIKRDIETQEPVAVYTTSVKLDENYGGTAPFVVDSSNKPIWWADAELNRSYLQVSQVTAFSGLSQISVD